MYACICACKHVSTHVRMHVRGSAFYISQVRVRLHQPTQTETHTVAYDLSVLLISNVSRMHRKLQSRLLLSASRKENEAV